MDKELYTVSLSPHYKEKSTSDVTLVNLESSKSIVRRKSSRLSEKQSSSIVDNIPNSEEGKRKHKLTIEEKQVLKELKNIKEQELPSTIRKKLLTLRIKLIHEVPPQHKIEGTGSHSPFPRDKQLFKNYGPLRKGPFSPAEDRIIKRNWKMFCKIHDWESKNVELFLKWRHDGKYYIRDVKERQKFVQFLADGLPWRTLYSVYSRFKILYCNRVTNVRYTVEEDKKILMYLQSKHLDRRNAKYIELAKLLKRTRKSVSKRYRYLWKMQNESEEELINVKWTLPLIKKFIKTLLDVTLSDDIRELKYAMLPKPVWDKIEEKLNINNKVLKAFWQNQLHLQLFSTGPVYLNDIKIMLIEYMYGKGVADPREIIWSNVAQNFDGATATFLCGTFFHLVQDCNINDTDKFADVVQYLYHTKIHEIKKAPSDKFLPRIIYKDGEINILNEEQSYCDGNC